MNLQDFIIKNDENFDEVFGKDGPERNCDSIGVGAGCDDCSKNIELRAKHKSFDHESITAFAEMVNEWLKNNTWTIENCPISKMEFELQGVEFIRGKVEGRNQAFTSLQSLLSPLITKQNEN